jgi:DNA primase
MEVLSAATDVFRFALQEWAASPAEMSGEEKRSAVEQFVALLASVSEPVIRNEAAQMVADSLRLEFETIWSRVKPRSAGRGGADRLPAAPISTGEKRILGAMLNGQMPAELLDRIDEQHFEDPASKNIYLAVKTAISEGQSLDFSEIATHLRGDAELTRLSELVLGEEIDTADAKALEETVRLMERRYLDRRSKEIQVQLQEALRLGDHEREHALLLEKYELSRQRHR